MELMPVARCPSLVGGSRQKRALADRLDPWPPRIRWLAVATSSYHWRWGAGHADRSSRRAYRGLGANDPQSHNNFGVYLRHPQDDSTEGRRGTVPTGDRKTDPLTRQYTYQAGPRPACSPRFVRQTAAAQFAKQLALD